MTRGVYARQSMEARFWSKVRKSDSCWGWVGPRTVYGYGAFWRDGQNRHAHRVSFELANGSVPEGLFVLHHCDNRSCVRPDHLYVGTHLDNMRDRNARGRTARGDRMPHERVHGEAHPQAKLTAEQVLDIRRRYQPGNGGVLMREFGISQAALWGIVNGKSWKHLERVEGQRLPESIW
jgi:hypothetical protein